MSLSPAEFRRAMGCFATGVTIITLDLEGEVHGMTANAFASVSLNPPLMLVCVDHSARTHAHMHAKKRFGINILAEDQRVISEYYAQPVATHAHAEAEAGARFDRTANGTPCCMGRWLIWSAGCGRRRMPATIRSSSPRWRRLWCAPGSRCFIFEANITRSVRQCRSQKKGPMPHEGGHRARGTRRRFSYVQGSGLLRTSSDITQPL